MNCRGHFPEVEKRSNSGDQCAQVNDTSRKNKKFYAPQVDFCF